MSAILPRQPAPSLEVATLDGETWHLSKQTPGRFTMIVFYRGLHCPICKQYLRDLDRNADEFRSRDINFITVSADTEERARTARDEWELGHTPIGYGLGIEKAREWGLFISSGRGVTSAGVEEPALFPEPGLFLVRPDGTLYASAVQTMPFARPRFKDLVGALDFIIEKDYPARGEA